MIMAIPTTFIWNVILFDEAFKYINVMKFWGYVGTNTESLCVQFCNSVKCHILVEYLTLRLPVRLCVSL
jgi:hypothetical protein